MKTGDYRMSHAQITEQAKTLNAHLDEAVAPGKSAITVLVAALAQRVIEEVGSDGRIDQISTQVRIALALECSRLFAKTQKGIPDV